MVQKKPAWYFYNLRSALLHEKMAHRYPDNLPHKHNKDHFHFRKHWRTHPVEIKRNQEHLEAIKSPPDLFRASPKEKMLKRVAKISVH